MATLEFKSKPIKNFKKFEKKVKSRFNKDIKVELADAIVAKILSGNSPVKRFKRFKKYSKEYGDRVKGRREPVDMLLEGDMLESIKITGEKLGELTIEFTDEKAAWHNNGEGNLPKRRLLPTGKNETFKQDIINLVVRKINRIIKSENA